MSYSKNKKLGFFQEFYSTLFTSLSGIIFSSVAVGQTCSPVLITSGEQTVVKFQTVTAGCNWTVPDGVTSIKVYCWGGGGAGGGVATPNPNAEQSAAGAGGKGGMCTETDLTVGEGATLRISVGDGGAGTTAAGNPGGASWVSTNTSQPWIGNTGAWASGGNGGGGATTGMATGASTYAAPNSGSGTIRNGGNGARSWRLFSTRAAGGGGGGGGTGANGVDAVESTRNPSNAPTSQSTGGNGGASDGGAGGNGAYGQPNNAAVGGSPGVTIGGGGGGAIARKNSTGVRSANGGNGARGEVWIIYDTPSPMPVTLTDFSAGCKEGVTHIIWTTASEQNSDYFTILRSRDGVNWSIVDKVPAAGTKKTFSTYNVYDNSSDGHVYYKLKQTDYDGTEKKYGIIFVDCNAKNSGISVYPNPNNGSFTVTVNAQEELGESIVFVHNTNGQIVATHNLNVLSGTNIIQFRDIERGTYLISVNGKNALKPVKLVVQ